ncbi:MAG: dihydrofolate reductase [Pirellulaceae bacterium]
MIVSLIVAMSENGVIGRDGDMPWRLSDDLRRFKRITMGHHLIMGRKTFDSIGRLLPGRTTIIMTRNVDYQVEGALIARDFASALALAAGDDEVFVVGGGEIYRTALPAVQRIYLTRVHTTLEGDTTFPEIDWDNWQRVSRESHSCDDRNNYDYTFEVYDRLANHDH